MKVKNVNPFEKHVEKIVLALAVAGAGYLGYSAFTDPVTVDRPDGGDPLTAEALEPAIGRSVDDLHARMEKNMSLALQATVTDYVADYKKIDKTPLPPVLLAEGVRYLPLQPAPSGWSGPNPGPQVAPIAIPTIPAPSHLTAEPKRDTVLVGATPTPKDLNWVYLQADYPMSKLAAAIHGVQHLPAENQRVTFYRVDVSRAEQLPNGSWSDWDPVAPTASVELPEADMAQFRGRNDANASTAITALLTKLDEGYANILHPSFYPSASGPVVPAGGAAVTPVPAPTARASEQAEDTRRRDAAAAEAQRAAYSSRTPAANVGSGPRTPNVGSGPRTPEAGSGPRTAVATPAPGGGAGATGVIIVGPGGAGGMVTVIPGQDLTLAPGGKDALLAEEEFPIWFYDEHVKPGTHYKYRMRLRVYNPVFRLASRLTDEGKRNEPWLASAWTDPPAMLDVEANRHFYVNGRGGADSSVDIKFYQWEKGRWFTWDQAVVPGQGVGKSAVRDGQTVDFTTGYTVVNVDNDANTTRVILMDPAGQLIVRDATVDSIDPQRHKIDKDIRDAAAAAAAAGTALAPGGG